MVDLTIAAIPLLGLDGAEALYPKRAATPAPPSAGDYEWRDTATSLGMGGQPGGSRRHPADLLRGSASSTGGTAGRCWGCGSRGRRGGRRRRDRPQPRSWQPVRSGTRRRTGRGADGARGSLRRDTATARTGDLSDSGPDVVDPPRRRTHDLWKRVAGAPAAAAIGAAGATIAGTWARAPPPAGSTTDASLPDLGTGVLAHAVAILGWDFIYYWNHRNVHQPLHVGAARGVPLERALQPVDRLRQPVADSLGTFVPTGALGLLGVRPEIVETARGINLIYQFWIHSTVVPKLGPF